MNIPNKKNPLNSSIEIREKIIKKETKLTFFIFSLKIMSKLS